MGTKDSLEIVSLVLGEGDCIESGFNLLQQHPGGKVIWDDGEKHAYVVTENDQVLNVNDQGFDGFAKRTSRELSDLLEKGQAIELKEEKTAMKDILKTFGDPDYNK